MQLEVRKYLFDIKRAVTYLVSFTDGKTQDDYLNDPLLRSIDEVACGGLSDWILACASMTTLINSARGRVAYSYGSPAADSSTGRSRTSMCSAAFAHPVRQTGVRQYDGV